MKIILSITGILVLCPLWAVGENPEADRSQFVVVGQSISKAEVDPQLGAQLRAEVRVRPVSDLAALSQLSSTKDQLKTRLHAAPSPGSGSGSKRKWVLVGVGAGLVGAGIWASTTSAYTGYRAVPYQDCGIYGCFTYYRYEYPELRNSGKLYGGIAGAAAGGALIWYGLRK